MDYRRLATGIEKYSRSASGHDFGDQTMRRLRGDLSSQKFGAGINFTIRRSSPKRAERMVGKLSRRTASLGAATRCRTHDPATPNRRWCDAMDNLRIG